MIKKYVILASLMSFLCLTGCEDMMGNYLEKAPSVDVTEDDIFSSATNVETFLASIYKYGIHSNLGYGDGDVNGPYGTIMAGATDEAETCAPWYSTNNWNSASITADRTDDGRFHYRWVAIRKVTTMLKRVDEVPDIDREYAEQLKAESKVIRALNYFEMFKHYGGVPIIDHYIELDEDFKIPRATVAQTVDFILKDIEEAMPALPDHQVGSMRGRVDKLTALAIKSRTLLYAASPQFNTATPYMSLWENNALICYGNYDPARWEAAAKAASECLKFAAEVGCTLVTDQGVDKNYQYSWEHYDNDEIILAEKAHGSIGKWTWPWNAIPSPNIYPGNAGQSGVTPTLNFVRKYERRDGTPEVWAAEGGDDLQAKMAGLDRRFAQTICGNLASWNSEFPRVEIFEGGKQSKTCHGGFWLHKLYPSEISEADWTYVPNSTLYQLNEIYLNFAEAMNEAYGADDAHGFGMTAREAVNTIRRRSGQPDITGDADKDAFRMRIRNERAVELAFDNHRLWDIRRWLIAEDEGVMQGDMWGIRITPVRGSSEYHYEPYVFETRSWNKRMYLHPFSTNEVNKGYLVQNPGY